MNEFELVEVGNRFSVFLYDDGADLLEGLRIEEAEGCAAVREDDVRGVVGQPPAFAAVGQCAQQAKAEAVINEGDVRLPGELDEGAAPVSEAFAEVLGVEALALQRAAGFKVVHAQSGAAIEAGALVKMAVNEDESLGEGVGIVRICVHDAIGVSSGG